jgi:hypothetical protein
MRTASANADTDESLLTAAPEPSTPLAVGGSEDQPSAKRRRIDLPASATKKTKRQQSETQKLQAKLNVAWSRVLKKNACYNCKRSTQIGRGGGKHCGACATTLFDVKHKAAKQIAGVVACKEARLALEKDTPKVRVLRYNG